MCDCFHLAFPNWHADSSRTGAGRRLRAPEPGTEDDSTCDEPSQFTERERPRPQGSSPVEEYPETEKYTDSDKECEAEHDPHHKSGSGKKTKKSGLGSMFEKRSTPKMSKLKEVHSPESGVIVKTAQDGCAEGLVYGGGGKEGIFIKEVVPESPASKSLKLKEGDQILSATVYFDNVSYEDAIQILEHAQAYKVKLCLKRKPDITESEPVLESDTIPEDDVYAPEMREQGKTRRRGDARISWPKFPSFGKGRKSRFTRSHSSSEADEQRKLELSPTTSDTESPIKSQDALKGKKKHKMKLSVLPKRGRISSSEDQDTDAPTTVQMISPDCLESLSGDTPQVYVTEDRKVVEDYQKLTEPLTEQHKVELITIDSTLKTEDLTMALAGQKSPSGNKSPDGKKKKKERSELKMRILGKDKANKKAKSSPKRLKTLGASIEIADQPENEKSDAILSFESHTHEDQLTLDTNTQISAKSPMEMSVPKVELGISDVALIRKSPQKGEEKAKKGKDSKTTFKLPKIGFTDIDDKETIPNMNVNVEKGTAKIELLTTEGVEVKEDPYERLSKSSLSRTKLPKREDIEIPGMEDMSRRTTAKGIKEPKAVFAGHYDDIQVETVQMSIDVDSVKEAVSKLPGFKLPKVDTSGVPIPEEITVIDANAQRISVKTPTKTKYDAHLSKFDVTASPEISKTTVKLPKISHADLTLEELLTVTHVKQSDKEVYEREHIIIPGKESAQDVALLQTQETQGTDVIKSEYQSAATFKSKRAKITMPSFGIGKPDIKIPDVGIHLPKGDNVKGERKIFLQEVEISKTENKIGGVISDVKIPEIDGIEYIDSVDGSPGKIDGGYRLTGFDVNLDAASPKADISFPYIGRDVEAEEHTFKLPKFGAVTPDISVNVPDTNKDLIIDGAEIKTLEREGKGGKFKIPDLGISMPMVRGPTIDLSLSKKDVDVTLPEAKAEVELPDIPEVTLGNVDVYIPEQKMDIKKPELEIKPWQVEGELDEQGSKFKKPKFGISMPKVKGPEFDLSWSKKDTDVTLPEAKAEVKLPEAPEIDVNLGTVDVQKPDLEIKFLRAEGELDGHGGKFKMPEFGVKMPKIKGPEFDFSSSKKDVTLPEVKAQVKLPDVEHTEPGIKVEVKAPEIAVSQKDVERSPSKFKMPTFKLPSFGVGTPNVSVEGRDMDKDVKITGANVHIEAPSVDIEGPSIDVKATGTDHEGKGGKFKMPHLGLSMPKVKGPQFNLSSSKKDVDVTLPEASAEVKLPEAPKIDVSLGKAEVLIPEVKVEVKKPEVKVKPFQTDVELEGQGGKFQMPKLGMSMPKVKGPEFHFGLTKKDGDVTLPEAKAEVELPEAPKISVDMKSPEFEGEIDGQGGKFKMPKLGMSMPKVKGPEFHFGLSKKDGDVTLPEVKAEVKVPDAPEVDVSLGKADVSLPKGKIEVKKPEIEIKPLESEVEIDGQGSKFKMPKLGMSMPKVKGPEFHFGLSKKDGDVTLPDAKAEVELPEAPNISVDMKSQEFEGEIDGQGSKFKMPRLGMSMPKVKGPEFHFGLSKKDGDVPLPEAKAEVKVPEVELKGPSAGVEIKAPEVKVGAKGKEGSPLKFKMPSFKLPKFGVVTPNVSVEVPDMDKDVKIDGSDIKIPDEGAAVHIAAPSIDIEGPSIDVKTTGAEQDGKGSKFKMPHLSFAMPKVKGPKMDVSLSKKDVDVKLPETKADVKLPEVDLGKVDVSIPEAKLEVTKPEIEMQIEGELDGQGEKLKMPKFGIKMPEFDFSSSKKDVDVTLPETKVEVKHPDAPKIDVSLGKAEVLIPAAKVKVEKPELEIKPLQTEVEGQGIKFKMPEFGMSMPKVKGPEFHLGSSKKDVDVTLPEAKAEVNLPDVELKAPSAKVEIKAPEIEAVSKDTEGSPSKFKMPSFSFSMPKIKGPAIDLSLSKKDTDITLPGTKAEIKLPEGPKIDASLGKAEVLIPEAKVEVRKPEVEIKPLQTDIELEGHKGKFQMPKFGITMPKVKGPDIDLSWSKKDVDVTLPEAKAEVELPDAPNIAVDMKPTECEGEIDGQGGKFKMPKFGVSMPKVKGPEFDLSWSKKDVDVTLPEAKAEVELPDAPKIAVEMKSPECEADIDGQGGKFKMPKFGVSMPKVKGPEFDLSWSKKDVDVTLPEAKAEVNLPDVELKEPSTKVEVKAPEIEAQLGSVKGSPSKFKLPTFKFPKFGAATPNVSTEVPDIDKEIKIDGGDMHVSVPHTDVDVPEIKAEIHLPKVQVKKPLGSIVIEQQPGVEVDAKVKRPRFSLPRFSFSKPSVKSPEVDASLQDVNVAIPEGKVEVKGGQVDVKLPECEAEVEGSKFKMPKFGISMPKVKGPEFDLSLSKKDVDGTLPEAKAEVELPDAPKIAVEIKPPECEGEIDGQGGKFKMPKFGITMPKVKGPEFDLSSSKKDVDVTLPEAKAEVELPDTPKIAVEMKPPECEGDIDGQGGKFKMPKFGITMPKVKGPEFDSSWSKKDVDVTLPEAKAEVELPDAPKIALEMKPPECEADIDGQGGKFKMPKFGITMPKVKGPEFDLSWSKKDVDVTLPEAKAEGELPDAPKIAVEMKQPECEADIDGQGGKFKMPTFGISMPKVKGPEFDLSWSKKDVDVTLPEAKAEVNLPDVELKESSAKVEVKAPEIEAQLGSVKGSPSKFKLPTFKFPKFGAATPHVSAEVPDIDKEIKIDGGDMHVSVPDTVVDVPEIKAEVHLPDVHVKKPSGGIVIEQQPGVEVDAKVKKPRFSLPRFSFSKPSVKSPEVDASLQDVNVAIPEGKVEVKAGEVDVELPECEAEVEGSKFKMPKFGITMPKVKGPEFDLSLSKKDVDVTLPEAKAEGELPDAPKIAVEMKPPECEGDIDGQGGKFKMPKFGVSMPKVKGPEFDLSWSKKDVDVTLPEAKAEVELPDVKIKPPSATVEIKAPQIEVQTGNVEGSPSKFRMPTFTLPKFGAATPKVSVEVPDVDKDIKIDRATVDVTAPSIDTEGLSVDVKAKGSELEGSGSKFKLPKFGISMPKVKGPEIDLRLSKKDVDLTVPEAQAEIQLPNVEVKEPKVEIKAPEIKVSTKDTDGSPSKFKMPTFKLPKFGIGTPSATVEVPDMDKDIKIDGADFNIPEEVLTVDMAAPSVDIEGPSIDIKTTGTEHEGKGSKFKLPSLGFSGPQVKQPDIDLSVSKKDVDVTLPEAKVDVKLPDVGLKEPSAKVEIKAPGIDVKTSNVEGSPSKLKMPTFKLPKFGASVEVPDVDKDIKVDGADLKLPEAKVEVKLPDVDIKEPMIEGDAKLRKTSWTMPKFSFSKTSVKAPEADVNLDVPKVDVSLPEAKADVNFPGIDIKESSGISIEGAPATDLDAKLKKPRFSLPRFSFSKQSSKESKVDVSLPDVDVSLPEGNVEVKQPEVEFKPPEVDVELERQESKFKLPKFGISMPKVKGPEIDLSLSKKDVDVTLPEAKAEVHLPDVKIKPPSATVEIKAPQIEVQTGNVEGSPSKLKMPTFTLPKFGVATPKVSVEVPDVDKDIKIDGTTVDVTAPSIDTEGLSVDVKAKGTELEGSGSKFKLPKFGISMPNVKGHEIDLSVSKKDVDVTLPEAQAEIQLPNVEVKEPKVEIKAPEIKLATKDTEGSPSKYKMPTFTLPKFGVATPKVSVEVPDVDKDIKIDGADIQFPEEVLAVHIAAPSVDIEGLSIDIKTTGTEHERKGSKFKLPSLGFSGPQVKQPDIDLSVSKKDVDVTLPEAKVDVNLPDVGLKEPSGEVEIKAPKIKVATKDTKVSPSKFKMPTFKLPKFGIGTPSATVEMPDMDKAVKIDGADIKIPEEVLTVEMAAPSVDIEGPSIDIKTTGTEHKGSKFTLPSFGFSGPQVKQPDIDLSVSKQDVDVTLPEAKVDVKLPDVGLKEPSGEVEIKAPKIKVATKDTKVSPSKFKMPTFKLPKFGIGTPSATVEMPDMDKDVKIDGADIKIPEEVLTVKMAAPSVDIEGPSIDIKTTGTEHEGSKFTLPSFGFSGPQVKQPDIDLSVSKKAVDVTLPEAKAEVHLPDVKIKPPSATVEIKAPQIEVQTGNVEGSPSKLKMPTFTLPKFGAATPKVSVEVPDVDKDIKIDRATVDVTAPSIDTEGLSVDVKAKGSELEGSGSKFKLPKFGISMPKVKGPEIDLSVSKKDVDVTLPEAQAEIQLPNVEVKEPKVEIKAPEIKVATKDREGSPSKYKMPTFKLPKFGIGTHSATVEVPDMDKDIKIDGSDINIPEEVLTVDMAAPSVDIEGPSIDIKTTGTEHEGKESKLKLPSLGFSGPQVKQPDIDLSISKKDVDVTLPEAEVKLLDVEVKETEGAISVPDAPTVEVDTKIKRPSWTFPKFSFSRTGGKAPDVDVNIETPKVDVTSPEVKVEVQGPSGAISMEEPPAAELDANLKKSKFSLPRFSFSKSSVKEPEELPHVDVSLPEGEVIVTQPEVKIKAPELEAEHDGQGSKFKLPKFGIALPKAKGPEEDLSASQKDAGITLPEVKAEVKLPEIEVKGSSASVEIKASETEAKGSPSKYKMPTLKMPKFGAATYDVTVEAPDAEKVSETDGAKLKEDVTVSIKGLSVDIKTDVSKAADAETPKIETDGAGLVSPSKFKLPSFGDILKSLDVEFDVPKAEQNLETSKEVHETNEPSGKQLEEKETKQDTIKSPERTGWFRFPKFGLSSPSEPAKSAEKDDSKDEKSPVWETADEELSPTCSVQSSDAFADISSAMTSEHVGLSSSSPTKVTVKYSDPNVATGLGEIHTNIVTSTTKTELISVEPNLPEKITILSSGVSSSSEDTLRLESGKIHVITSNIQATPEAEHARLLSAVHIQSAGGLPLESGANEAASWTVEDSQGGKKTVFERHSVKQTSSERSESKETIVITKQITRRFDSSEPISGETASSIQRLRDSVHSEKMRFFDGVDE